MRFVVVLLEDCQKKYNLPLADHNHIDMRLYRMCFFSFNHHHLLLEAMMAPGGPLLYQSSTINIVMISPSIFMSVLWGSNFVYPCLICDHCDMCWMHFTS